MLAPTPSDHPNGKTTTTIMLLIEENKMPPSTSLTQLTPISAIISYLRKSEEKTVSVIVPITCTVLVVETERETWVVLLQLNTLSLALHGLQKIMMLEFWVEEKAFQKSL